MLKSCFYLNLNKFLEINVILLMFISVNDFKSFQLFHFNGNV